MARVLVSWIGNTDLLASRGDPKVGLGPIAQALKAREFDELVLISNYKKSDSQAFMKWVEPQTRAELKLEPVMLEDPTDFPGIYRAVDPVLRNLTERFERAGERLALVLHLSPGTPAMATMWMLLGKTRYPAELIQSSREQGVKTAAVPFDIVAEFIEMVPALTAEPDAALEARSAFTAREATQFGHIVYRARAMHRVVEQAKRVAVRSVSVLIQGETGTGKELLARAIHHASPRAKKPFVPVNCGAISAHLVESELFGHKKGAFTGATESRLGRFRSADEGTLFLDELGELPLDAQVKLLRALQEGEIVPVGETRPVKVNVRVIAATHRNLLEEVRRQRFREDLFYRLAVAVLHLPPLREREGDLGMLIDALLAKANEKGEKEEPGYVKKKLAPAAKTLLLNHRWPGNVRELENTLMRATVWATHATISEAEARAALFQGVSSGGPSGALSVPDTIEDGFVLETLLDQIRRQYIERAVQQTHGNKTRASKLLGMNSHQVLSGHMRRLGLET